MTDLILRIGFGSLCLSFGIAVVAGMVQRFGRQPRVAHLLWLFVLIKLVTPPFVTLPVIVVPGLAVEEEIGEESPVSATRTSASVDTAGAVVGETTELRPTPVRRTETTSAPSFGKTGLVAVWLVGTVFLFIWSGIRILRFHRLLNLASSPAPKFLRDIVRQLTTRFELRRVPDVVTTTAHMSPMVWWVGGTPRVVVPETLLSEIPTSQLRWVLAHELAHIRRRDHWVRWLEWGACVGFWWNPVAWWARRSLRANEEICCDALVLDVLEPVPATYAESLLNVVEYLALPALRPPTVASEINSGGILERRLEMIVSQRPVASIPAWTKSILVVAAVALMPLGVAYAQDGDNVRKKLVELRKELGEAVEEGKITREEARAKYEAIEKKLRGKKGQGDDRQASLEDLFAKAGVDARGLNRFAAALEKGGAAKDETDRMLRIVLKLATIQVKNGDTVEVNDRIAQRLAQGGYSEKQIDLMTGLAGRVAQAMKQKAQKKSDPQAIAGSARVTRYLKDIGLSPEQLEKVQGALRRVAGAAERHMSVGRATGWLPDYLVKIGLTEKQEASVIGLAKRIVAAASKSEDSKSETNWVGSHLKKAELSPDQMKKVEGALERVVGAAKKGGSRRVMAWLPKYLAEIGLTAEQEKTVLGISKRLMEQVKRRGDRRDASRAKFEAIAKKIRAAVEAGKLTEEEANKKLGELRRAVQEWDEKKSTKADGEKRQARYKAYAERIHKAVKAGKLTEKEAKEKLVELRRRMARRAEHDDDGERRERKRHDRDRDERREHDRRR